MSMRKISAPLVLWVALSTGMSLLSGLRAQSSNPACPNANFNIGDFTNWVGRTGTCCPIAVPTLITPTPGNTFIVNNRQTLVGPPFGTPFDAVVTGNQLPTHPPGTTRAARLGNSGTGAQAEALEYNFVKATGNELLTVKFAVVMQDPGHTVSQQPRFEFQVTNQNTGLPVPCTFYQVAAAGSIPGFTSQGQIRWLQWTTVGVDLSGIPNGTPLTVVARTGDCSLSGHYGYGYVWADCSPLQINISYCLGDNSATLSAPDGFQNYLWSTGATTKDITIPNPANGSTYTCQITSFTGCNATLTAVLQPTIPTAAFTGQDVCQGVVNFTDNSTATNGTINGWSWNFGDGSPVLTGTQNPSHTYANEGAYNVQLISSTPAGCTDTIVVPVNVSPILNAQFQVPNPCGLTANFADQSTISSGNITSWNWNFGVPGGTTATQNPSFNFPATGTYNVELVITNANNCTDTLIQPITINSVPTAAFNTSPVCEGNLSVFTDNSSNAGGPITNWQWTFGSGAANSTQQNPNFNYPTFGNYNVQLIVTGPGNCKDTVVQQVTVNPNPNTNFTPPGPCGLTQGFTDATVVPGGSSASQWSWSFGAAGTSSLQNPTFTFPAPGTYNIQLIASTAAGCSDTLVVPYTTVGDVTAAFTHTNVCQGLALPFNSTSTTQADNIVGWGWLFGNNNTGTGSSTTHLYAAPGTYNVTLGVLTAAGCTDSVTVPVTVHPNPIANFVADSVCSGQTTNFQNTSTVLAPDAIVAYDWNFNNVVPNSNLVAPNVSFPTWGSYTINLTATTNNGCSANITKVYRVNPRPVLAFQAVPNEGCQPLTVNMTNQSFVPGPDTVVSWVWAMGNGGNASGATPNYTYTGSGLFTVTLTASTEHGCDTTITLVDHVTVHPKPNSAFIFNNVLTNYCFNDNSVTTNNFSTIGAPGVIATNDWNVTGPGFNQNVTGDNLTGLTVPNPGLYNVALISTSDEGCKDTTETILVIHPNPVALFESTTDCFWENTFTSLTTGGTPNYQFDWDMGADGVSDYFTEGPILHIWDTSTVAGPHPVTLTVIDQNGCASDTTMDAIVKPAPLNFQYPNVLVVNPQNPGNDKYDFEVFAPEFNECVDYTFSIFNRWGTKVFETENKKVTPDLTCTNCWRGKDDGGNSLTDGVYFFVLRGERNIEKQGSIHLFNLQP